MREVVGNGPEQLRRKRWKCVYFTPLLIYWTLDTEKFVEDLFQFLASKKDEPVSAPVAALTPAQIAEESDEEGSYQTGANPS